MEQVLEKEKKEKINKEKKEETKINKTKGLSFYICCFFIYCVIGWIYEVTWEAAIGNGFVNRGFLNGCYLPIYGFGTIILYFILNKLMKKKIKLGNINITPIIVFLAVIVMVSTIEYVSSFAMESIFNKRWWDYSYDILNINGRVSLRNSSILSAGAMLFLYGIEPLLRKLFSKFKQNILKNLAIVITSVMIIDLFVTIIRYLIK